MINRVINKNGVYYKMIDLADLFEVSVYIMKKIIKKQNIETTRLEGFGRSVFVLEENVCKIEVNDKVTIVNTTIEENIKKKAVKKAKKTPAKKTQVKKSEKKSEKKNDVENPADDTNEKVELTDDEKIQNELKALITSGKLYAVKFINEGQYPLAVEISAKHLGAGNLLKNATLCQIVQVRSLVAELKSEYAKLNVEETQSLTSSMVS